DECCDIHIHYYYCKPDIDTIYPLNLPQCRVWVENKECSYDSKKSLWHKFAVFISNKWYSLIVIVVVICMIIPFCVFIKDFSWNENDNELIPPSSDSMVTRSYILNEYPEGVIYPYELVITTKSDIDVFSTQYEKLTTNLMDSFTQYPDYFSNTSYTCINYFNGHSISGRAMKWLYNDDLYKWFFDKSVSPDKTTTRCTFIPLFNPIEQSSERLDFVRGIINNVTQYNTDYNVYVRGFEVDISDSMVVCFKYFPIIVIVLFGIVLIITGISFQSLIVPLRVVFSTVTTVLWTYGFASFVFCNDYFDWTADIMAESSGLFWVVPVITFPIIIGLSSDYDVFLFSRIMEFRRKGLSTKLSVIVGVEKAGYLISYAGIIMAVAFSGLFLSNVLMLNQFAFILTFSVLLDTFVVRSLLLPAIVNILGELNWFPRKYKIVTSDYEDYYRNEQIEEDKKKERNEMLYYASLPSNGLNTDEENNNGIPPSLTNTTEVPEPDTQVGQGDYVKIEDTIEPVEDPAHN
ncbi:MmpL efflux pump, putative, partial [Entamoeba invadens IP1]